jgi:hypothetical protein
MFIIFSYLVTVPRRIFGPKRDEVIGGWRKQHNEELHNMYSSPSIIIMIKSRRMRHVAHVGEKRNSGGKARRRENTRKTRRRWEDIKLDLREIGWDDMDWINLAQDRDQWRVLVNTIMNLHVP